VEVGGEILERLGYQVTGVTSSVKALEAFRIAPDAFDAVVADLTMPGIPGLALARRMRAIRPGLPFVLTSGYVRTEDAEAVQVLGAIELVPKPAVLGELGAALRRLLD
jgi:CheY-like chemotaxis protein